MAGLEERGMDLVFVYEDDENVEQEHVFPSRNEVCSRCDGEGSHVNPAVECDGGGITGSEMAEILSEDPEFLDNYMGGTYDIPCTVCHGNKVVRVIDEDAVERDPKHAAVFKLFCDEAQAESEYQAERRAEERMGC